jgi:diguanylate cyclase (GGDEF)-like protein/PAS domain S-box-containing protein
VGITLQVGEEPNSMAAYRQLRRHLLMTFAIAVCLLLTVFLAPQTIEVRALIAAVASAGMGYLLVVAFRQVGVLHREAQELESLEQNSRMYRSLVESSPDAIVWISPEGMVSMANQQAMILFGYKALGDIEGIPCTSFVSDYGRVLEWFTMRSTFQELNGRQTEWEFIRQDGSTFPGEASSAAILDAKGHYAGITVVVRDITERKRLEAELEAQGTQDPLTGMINRLGISRRLQRAVELARSSGERCSFMLIDLRRLREINQAFGHSVGDQMILEVSRRLRGLFKDSDCIGRVSGDEFGVLLTEASALSVTQAAEQVHRSLATPITLQSEPIAMGCTVGISTFPEDASSGDDLMRHADLAADAAKHELAETRTYDAVTHEASAGRLRLLSDLGWAIEHDQLELYYQPKVNLQTNQTDYVEGLLRWNHPERGTIPPNEFIPLAEQAEIIKPLTTWVIRTAMRQCRGWYEAGMQVNVAVNLSARNLHDPSLPDTIARIVREMAASPSWLKLEVTESILMADAERALDTLNRIRTMGVSLSIDDFGTGYSSLAYLKRFPVGEIKIDRSFVSEMILNEEDAAIVRSVIDLGHSLNLQVVAEGVEDEATLEALKAWQCDHAQGFYLGVPMPAAQFLNWLERWNGISHRRMRLVA